ncbi:MAG: acyltransferase family protein [Clostridia bacterium]|nr:acyltransferase family protein [Clostridia bacterium]
MSQAKRHLWIDILKIFACFLVIINHSHRHIILAAGINSATALFDAILFPLCKSAVPLFAMASGYLLLNVSSEHSIKKTLSRVARVAVPLLFFSALYFFFASDNSGGIIPFFKALLRDPLGTHFWYLYMLLGLYFAVPFMARAVKGAKNSELAVFVAVFLLIPSVAKLTNVYLGITFSRYFEEGLLPVAIAYLVAGALLSRIKLSRLYLWLAVAIYALSISGFALSIYLPYKESGFLNYDLDSWEALPVVLSSLCLFYIIRYLFENKPIGDKSAKIISEISATTFGIYIIHPYILMKMFGVSFFTAIFRFNFYLGALAIPLICFAICLPVIWIAKKIPVIKRFI